MSERRKQTFLQSAVILVIANLLVKVIGALFKIPLGRLLGEDGSGLFNSAYTLYTFMFVVATAGFPVAVSKMVAESMAHNNEREARRILYISLGILGLVGLLGSGALYFFAYPFATILKNDRAYLAIQAIAPAVFFVAVTSAFRGYFQGRQNMYPTAVSEVIEACSKLFVGYFLAAYLMGKGVEHGASGAVFGATVGTVISALLLYSIYGFSKKRTRGPAMPARSVLGLAKTLIFIAVPVTIGASVASLTNVADLFTITNRLQEIPGMTQKMASAIFGAYSMHAGTFFQAPLTIVSAIAISVVPTIAASLEMGRKLAARTTVEISIRITLLFALPCAVGLMLLAEPILFLAFKSVAAVPQLQILSVAVVFVSLLSVTNAILQSYGKMLVPVVNMIIGGVIKVSLNWIFIPVFGINAAPVSTGICYFIIIVMNLIWIAKISGAHFKFMDFFVKPLVSAGAMAICVYFLFNYLTDIKIHSIIVLSVAVAVGGLVYALMLFIVQAIKREDIELLPFGLKIADFLTKMKFLRS